VSSGVTVIAGHQQDGARRRLRRVTESSDLRVHLGETADGQMHRLTLRVPSRAAFLVCGGSSLGDVTGADVPA